MSSEILAENIAFDENGLYIPQTWLDGVGEGNYTPLTAARMNHIEQGIKGLSEAWDSQSQAPIVIRWVSGSIKQQPANYASISAPTVEGYSFLTWYNANTTGWIGTLSFSDASRPNTNIWVTNTYDNSTNSGKFWAYALYSLTK